MQIRIVNADFYMNSPIQNLDALYSEFRGSATHQVPVLRIFGSTDTGIKTCLHVHGVFPYIYIPYDGQGDVNSVMYQLATSLDKAINVSLGHTSSNVQHIFKISLVSGIPFYGYHPKHHQFFKIYFYNPLILKKACALLQNGSILGKIFQPHEAHIPYVLQFMIDYNLYGMSFIQLSEVKYRSNSDLVDISEELILPSTIQKMSTCKMEVDALAESILNRQEVNSQNLGLNPGIQALWNDEKQRRRDLGDNSLVEHCLTQNRVDIEPTATHLAYFNALNEKLQKPPKNEEKDAQNLSVYPAETPKDTSKRIVNASTVESHTQGSQSSDSTFLDFTITPEEHEANLTLDNDALQLLEVLGDLRDNLETDSILSQALPEQDEDEEEKEEDLSVALPYIPTPTKSDPKNVDMDDENLDECYFNLSVNIPQLDGCDDLTPTRKSKRIQEKKEEELKSKGGKSSNTSLSRSTVSQSSTSNPSCSNKKNFTKLLDEMLGNSQEEDPNVITPQLKTDLLNLNSTAEEDQIQNQKSTKAVTSVKCSLSDTSCLEDNTKLRNEQAIKLSYTKRKKGRKRTINVPALNKQNKESQPSSYSFNSESKDELFPSSKISDNIVNKNCSTSESLHQIDLPQQDSVTLSFTDKNETVKNNICIDLLQIDNLPRLEIRLYDVFRNNSLNSEHLIYKTESPKKCAYKNQGSPKDFKYINKTSQRRFKNKKEIVDQTDSSNKCSTTLETNKNVTKTLEDDKTSFLENEIIDRKNVDTFKNSKNGEKSKRRLPVESKKEKSQISIVDPLQKNDSSTNEVFKDTVTNVDDNPLIFESGQKLLGDYKEEMIDFTIMQSDGKPEKGKERTPCKIESRLINTIEVSSSPEMLFESSKEVVEGENNKEIVKEISLESSYKIHENKIADIEDCLVLNSNQMLLKSDRKNLIEVKSIEESENPKTRRKRKNLRFSSFETKLTTDKDEDVQILDESLLRADEDLLEENKGRKVVSSSQEDTSFFSTFSIKIHEDKITDENLSTLDHDEELLRNDKEEMIDIKNVEKNKRPKRERNRKTISLLETILLGEKSCRVNHDLLRENNEKEILKSSQQDTSFSYVSSTAIHEDKVTVLDEKPVTLNTGQMLLRNKKERMIDLNNTKKVERPKRGGKRRNVKSLPLGINVKLSDNNEKSQESGELFGVVQESDLSFLSSTKIHTDEITIIGEKPSSLNHDEELLRNDKEEIMDINKIEREEKVEKPKRAGKRRNVKSLPLGINLKLTDNNKTSQESGESFGVLQESDLSFLSSTKIHTDEITTIGEKPSSLNHDEELLRNDNEEIIDINKIERDEKVEKPKRGGKRRNIKSLPLGINLKLTDNNKTSQESGESFGVVQESDLSFLSSTKIHTDEITTIGEKPSSLNHDEELVRNDIEEIIDISKIGRDEKVEKPKRGGKRRNVKSLPLGINLKLTDNNKTSQEPEESFDVQELLKENNKKENFESSQNDFTSLSSTKICEEKITAIDEKPLTLNTDKILLKTNKNEMIGLNNMKKVEQLKRERRRKNIKLTNKIEKFQEPAELFEFRELLEENNKKEVIDLSKEDSFTTSIKNFDLEKLGKVEKPKKARKRKIGKEDSFINGSKTENLDDDTFDSDTRLLKDKFMGFDKKALILTDTIDLTDLETKKPKRRRTLKNKNVSFQSLETNSLLTDNSVVPQVNTSRYLTRSKSKKMVEKPPSFCSPDINDSYRLDHDYFFCPPISTFQDVKVSDSDPKPSDFDQSPNEISSFSTSKDLNNINLLTNDKSKDEMLNEDSYINFENFINNDKSGKVNHISIWENNNIIKVNELKENEDILEISSDTNLSFITKVQENNKDNNLTMSILNNKSSTPIKNIKENEVTNLNMPILIDPLILIEDTKESDLNVPLLNESLRSIEDPQRLFGEQKECHLKSTSSTSTDSIKILNDPSTSTETTKECDLDMPLLNESLRPIKDPQRLSHEQKEYQLKSTSSTPTNSIKILNDPSTSTEITKEWDLNMPHLNESLRTTEYPQSLSCKQKECQLKCTSLRSTNSIKILNDPSTLNENTKECDLDMPLLNESLRPIKDPQRLCHEQKEYQLKSTSTSTNSIKILYDPSTSTENTKECELNMPLLNESLRPIKDPQRLSHEQKECQLKSTSSTSTNSIKIFNGPSMSTEDTKSDLSMPLLNNDSSRSTQDPQSLFYEQEESQLTSRTKSSTSNSIKKSLQEVIQKIKKEEVSKKESQNNYNSIKEINIFQTEDKVLREYDKKKLMMTNNKRINRLKNTTDTNKANKTNENDTIEETKSEGKINKRKMSDEKEDRSQKRKKDDFQRTPNSTKKRDSNRTTYSIGMFKSPKFKVVESNNRPYICQKTNTTFTNNCDFAQKYPPEKQIILHSNTVLDENQKIDVSTLPLKDSHVLNPSSLFPDTQNTYSMSGFSNFKRLVMNEFENCYEENKCDDISQINFENQNNKNDVKENIENVINEQIELIDNQKYQEESQKELDFEHENILKMEKVKEQLTSDKKYKTSEEQQTEKNDYLKQQNNILENKKEKNIRMIQNEERKRQMLIHIEEIRRLRGLIQKEQEKIQKLLRCEKEQNEEMERWKILKLDEENKIHTFTKNKETSNKKFLYNKKQNETQTVSNNEGVQRRELLQQKDEQKPEELNQEKEWKRQILLENQETKRQEVKKEETWKIQKEKKKDVKQVKNEIKPLMSLKIDSNVFKEPTILVKKPPLKSSMNLSSTKNQGNQIPKRFDIWKYLKNQSMICAQMRKAKKSKDILDFFIKNKLFGFDTRKDVDERKNLRRLPKRLVNDCEYNSKSNNSREDKKPFTGFVKYPVNQYSHLDGTNDSSSSDDDVKITTTAKKRAKPQLSQSTLKYVPLNVTYTSPTKSTSSKSAARRNQSRDNNSNVKALSQSTLNFQKFTSKHQRKLFSSQLTNKINTTQVEETITCRFKAEQKSKNCDKVYVDCDPSNSSNSTDSVEEILPFQVCQTTLDSNENDPTNSSEDDLNEIIRKSDEIINKCSQKNNQDNHQIETEQNQTEKDKIYIETDQNETLEDADLDKTLTPYNDSSNSHFSDDLFSPENEEIIYQKVEPAEQYDVEKRFIPLAGSSKMDPQFKKISQHSNNSSSSDVITPFQKQPEVLEMKDLPKKSSQQSNNSSSTDVITPYQKVQDNKEDSKRFSPENLNKNNKMNLNDTISSLHINTDSANEIISGHFEKLDTTVLSIYEPSKNNQNLNENKEDLIITPKFNPPSREMIEKSLNMYNIPEVRNQEPFYSDRNDVTGNVEIGRRVLKISSNNVVDLPNFKSNFEGIESQKKKNLQVLEVDNKKLTSKEILQYKLSTSNNCDVIVTPGKLPPTRKDVEKWLQEKSTKKGIEKDKGKEKKKVFLVNSPSRDGEESFDSLSLSPCTPIDANSTIFKLDYSQFDAKDDKLNTKDDKLNTKEDNKIQNKEKNDTSPRLSKKSKDDKKIRKIKIQQVKKDLTNDSKINNLKTQENIPTVKDSILSSNDTIIKNLSSNSSVNSHQITAVTQDTSTNFLMASHNLNQAKAVKENLHLTILSIEVVVISRNEYKPNPELDPIKAIIFTMYNNENISKGGFIINSLPTSPSKIKISILNGIDSKYNLKPVNSELELINEFVQFVKNNDPDIFVGFEIEMLSWGFLIERGYVLGLNLTALLSRTPENIRKKRADDEQDLIITGRILIDFWRLLRHEIALTSYTFENIVYHILHRRIPLFTHKDLTYWLQHPTSVYRNRVIEYYSFKTGAILQIMDQLDLIGRTSELAKLFGIQFYEVLSRGSQFRVESMMLRLAKPLNFIPVSPNQQQRAKMRAPESLPLIMEPESKFYTDPVIVLDFQSLYPSMMIAYNYCFSTCLGRIEHLGGNSPFEFGTTQLKVSRKYLKYFLNKKKLNISPCGIAFVNKSIRLGILPRMLQEILDTRLMVKKSLKQNSENKVLSRVLDARQLGLKLIANVTYGYTAANFSGRMPCIELGDSVVSKGRETLQRAINLVEKTPEWGAKVIYGDTDSLFVLVPGKSRETAFKIGAEIAEAVTNANPSPVKLKLEKILQPCILQTKKRYVGYMYESPDQQEPEFLAKGIETVRRDGCPASAKMLEKCLKILFETRDVSLVKKYVIRQFGKLLSGRVSIQDLTFAKEYRGASSYKPGACVPALELTRKWTSIDKRNEPRRGERVPYVIINGPPGEPLIRLVRSPRDLLNDPSLRINALYYITKAIIPPINRCFLLIGADLNQWFNEMPRKQYQYLPTSSSPGKNKTKRNTITQFFSSLYCAICGTLTQEGLCGKCKDKHQESGVLLHEKVRLWEQNYFDTLQICQSCCGRQDEITCVSLDCPVYYRRIQTSRDLQQSGFIRQLITTLPRLEF